MNEASLLIFIPTYNEKDNVPLLYEALKKLPIKAHILFCDDSSPDGTGQILDTLALTDTSLSVMHRTGKMGLGTAHLAAFTMLKRHNYEFLLTMDADFTHDPSYIAAMLEKIKHNDIVIGSRYAPGGGMREWSSLRLPLTYFWRTLIKYGLNLAYDATGAFRLYRVSILRPELCQQFTSKEFSFNIETLYYFKRHRARIVEVPIIAHNRVRGVSKLSGALMREEAALFLRLLLHRVKNWRLLKPA